jgi:hypothetical protein
MSSGPESHQRVVPGPITRMTLYYGLVDSGERGPGPCRGPARNVSSVPRRTHRCSGFPAITDRRQRYQNKNPLSAGSGLLSPIDATSAPVLIRGTAGPAISATGSAEDNGQIPDSTMSARAS